MIPGDPNVQSVELVAAALGDLRDELVLVGGCAASLLIDAPSAPPPRVTYDVDLVAEVAALKEYYVLEREFSARGFVRDVSPDAPICRWCIGAVKVDLMPTSEAVLGFSNRWYVEAVRSAAPLRLPSGTVVRLISAPAFMATKFEAFRTRGRADLISSHDFEDIINVVEGRPTLVEEIASAEVTLRAYLIGQFADVSAAPGFANTLPGLVAYDELHGQRVAAVMKRIETIAARATNGVP